MLKTNSCKDCLTTNWPCNWCANENVCLFNTSKCERNSLASANLISLSSTTNQQNLKQQTTRQSTHLMIGSQSNGPQNTLSSALQCPSFERPEIAIADGTSREIEVKVRNLSNGQLKVSFLQTNQRKKEFVAQESNSFIFQICGLNQN